MRLDEAVESDINLAFTIAGGSAAVRAGLLPIEDAYRKYRPLTDGDTAGMSAIVVAVRSAMTLLTQIAAAHCGTSGLVRKRKCGLAI